VDELDLPMSVRLMEANPYVEEARNHAAVMRGPIVYCLESPDLPAGVRVLDVGLSRGASFASSPGEGVLSFVRVLRGSVLARAGRTWTGRLYQPLSTDPPAAIPGTLVPYFAWDNRGTGEMTVWLPLFD
jgi:hypothetical protein